MGRRIQEIKRGPRKGEVILMEPPHLEPSEPGDQERMRSHVKNGWSFYVGSELYVLMDFPDRGSVYMRKGPKRRFNQMIGRVQEVFSEQLKEPAKPKKRRKDK